MTDFNMPPGCSVAEMERATVGDELAECLGCERPFGDDAENDYCPSCRQNQDEAAYERYLESYHGGDIPTMDEQHRLAWEEHQRLHR